METLKFAGICFEPKLRVYVLWTLKLMKDVKSIFTKVDFIDMSSNSKDKSEKSLKEYDVIITDSDNKLDLKSLNDSAIIAFIRSNYFYL